MSAVRRASLSLLVSATLFAAMALVARLVSRRIPGPEVALVRFAAGIVAVAAARVLLRVRLRPRRWGWLAARGVAGGFAVVLYFLCIEHMGAGMATLLNYTAPVWTLFLGWLLLGERPQRRAVLALALTMVGVALVAGGGEGWHVGGWALVAVLSAILSGVALTSIRAVRRPEPDGTPAESSWMVFASFTSLGFLATLPATFGGGRGWVPPSAFEWSLLLTVGLLSVGAQLIMTSALRHVTATTSGIIHQLTVVLSMTGGILLFGERLTVAGALGGAITVLGVLFAAVSEGGRPGELPPPP